MLVKLPSSYTISWPAIGVFPRLSFVLHFIIWVWFCPVIFKKILGYSTRQLAYPAKIPRHSQNTRAATAELLFSPSSTQQTAVINLIAWGWHLAATGSSDVSGRITCSGPLLSHTPSTLKLSESLTPHGLHRRGCLPERLNVSSALG